jgi:hypothetical protein
VNLVLGSREGVLLVRLILVSLGRRLTSAFGIRQYRKASYQCVWY